MKFAMRAVAFTAIILVCANLRAQPKPARLQFEVASVKPASNDETSRAPRLREMMREMRRPGAIPMDNPGRVRLDNWALVDLIAAAFRVRAAQVSGPGWLSDQSFDIEARLPDGAKKEDLNAMLQALLEDRFGLKVHRDTRTGQGFALVVGKNGPKLKPSDPPPAPAEGLSEEEQKAKRQQQAQARLGELQKRMQENRENGTPMQGFSRANFPSITAEQLALNLVRFAGAPVVDETGLTGKYSVTIETWKNPDIPGGTIFDAVEKLGLKLESRKVTIETVIVDQINKTPTAN